MASTFLGWASVMAVPGIPKGPEDPTDLRGLRRSRKSEPCFTAEFGSRTPARKTFSSSAMDTKKPFEAQRSEGFFLVQLNDCLIEP